MGVVTQTRQGLIYNDDFSASALDSRWEVVPQDANRWSLTDAAGMLRLKHGANPLYLFFQDLMSTEQFVMDIKTAYNPTAADDSSGIIVYASDTDYIALEGYYDAATAHMYPWLRLVRNYNTYSGYASDDGVTWTIIGTEAFDHEAPKIGLFLLGAAGANFDIDSIRIVTSLDITVDNLTGGTKVELLNNAGTLLDTKICRTNDSQVHLQTGPAITGRFRITLPNGDVFETTDTFPIAQGDQFKLDVSLNLLFVDNSGNTPVEVPITASLEQFLGYMKTAAGSDVQLILRNPFTGTFNSIQVQLAAYHGTDQYSRLVQIAPDVSGAPGTYGSQLNITQITAAGEYRFWAHLSRETDPTKFSSEVFFGLNISSQLTY